MRFLLANYLQPRDGGVDVDRLRFAPIASLRSTFDDWSGLESSELTSDEIDACRADVFRAMAGAAPSTIFLKIHDAWRREAAGRPLFPADVTLRVIYIVRDPVDIAVSLAHHMDVDNTTAVRWMCDDGFLLVPSRRSLDSQLPQLVGSWTSHVGSWLDESELPVTVVRFEDLVRNAAAQLSKILVDIGEEVDAGRVAKAVGDASFARLQQQERERGFPERLSRATNFFRSGRAGEGRRVLTHGERERLRLAHLAAMRRFDYHESEPNSSAWQAGVK